MAPTNDSHTHRAPEPLWREVTGRVLRRHRHERGERLIETARRAGVSSQYLSEIERGRKDASSEFLAAVAGAVGLSLLDLAREAAAELARLESVDTARKAGASVRLRCARSRVLRNRFGRALRFARAFVGRSRLQRDRRAGGPASQTISAWVVRACR